MGQAAVFPVILLRKLLRIFLIFISSLSLAPYRMNDYIDRLARRSSAIGSLMIGTHRRNEISLR